MEPAMRIVLLITVLGFTVFFSVLLMRRQMQLRLKNTLIDLMRETEARHLSASTQDV
jgi:hypothetical protein